MLAGGIAALSWEVIWQLELGLALGVSAEGTALTLACMMGGMTLGSWLMGRVLERRKPERPLRWYAILELLVGLSGLALRALLGLVAHADASVSADASASTVHLVGVVLVLGIPTTAMGASLPLFGLIARQYGSRLSHLYGLNTLGAAVGTLLLALVVMPALGVGASVFVVAAIDVSIAALAWSIPRGDHAPPPVDAASTPTGTPTLSPALAKVIVVVTGFATFALEVAWFRALRAAYFSTTYTFAILVAAVLVPIALAARVAARLRARGGSLGPWLAAAAVAILVATPIVERFDRLANVPFFFFLLPSWFLQTLLVVGPAMFFLGIALPWILEDQAGARGWGALYALNTIGAIAGALAAAWLLLPAIGIARTAWIAGGLVAIVALLALRGRARGTAAGLVVAALAVAVVFESGLGRTRTIGATGKLLAFRESADFTVSVVDDGTTRQLYIDGFVATSEAGFADYMVWMGRLPALLHPHPEAGLVICFGTGQTANALRREHVTSLDIVDISQAVFDLAPNFPKNEGVLDDPIVHHHRVDGRSWLRRTEARYDVITLEPMPPTFAGVNGLYSREFYELVKARLRPGGVAAQWLPFHLVDPLRGVSIATTFRAVFPDAILWVHPDSGTGILLGSNAAADAPALGSTWPGLTNGATYALSADAIRGATVAPEAFANYAAAGRVITDDNQLLAYGFDPRNGDLVFGRMNASAHAALLAEAKKGPVKLPPGPPFEPWRWVLSLVTILVAARLTMIVRRDLRRRFAQGKSAP